MLPTITMPYKLRIPLFIVLIAAGLAGNYLKYPIFLNIDFIFGSMFAMLALQFFGLGRGIVAAAAIAGYTYVLWNHPYAIIIMTAEVAVVGFLMSRRKMGMVLADALYWLIIGMPLVYLFYHLVMQVTPGNCYFVMTKQTINGIANALVARLVFSGFASHARTEKVPYNEVIYNLLAFFVLCPALVLLAVSSRSDFAETNNSIKRSLFSISRRLDHYIETWQHNRKTAVEALADMASSRPPEQMQPYLELTKKADPNLERIGMLNASAVTIAYAPLTDETGASNIGISFEDRPYFRLLERTQKSMLSDVYMGKIGTPGPKVLMLAPIVVRGKFSGYITGVLNLQQIAEQLTKSLSENDTLFTLLDKNGNIILTNRTDQKVMSPLVRGKGTLTKLDKDLSQWIPELPSNISISERWKKSFYCIEAVIGDKAEWKLILEQPVAPYQKKLYDNYSSKLTILLLILLASLGLAEKLSRRTIGALQESEERFRSMFYSHSAIMLLIEPVSGKIVDANQAAEQFYGYPRQRLLTMNISDINQFSPEQIEFERTGALNMHVNHFIFPHRLSNGTMKTVEVHTTPVIVLKTKLLFSIVHDISERKQAEKALQMSEERLSTMISNISDVISILGVDGYMKYNSSNIEKWFGWQPSDLIGTDGWLTVHPDDLERIQKEFFALLGKDNSVKMVEYRYKCKDGSYLPIHLTATNLVNNPVINGVLLNYHSITKRKQAEEELLQAKELAESVTLAKSRFLSIVAHEFHTPLHLLTISMDILEQYEGRLSTDEQLEQHNQIRNAANQLSSLIDSVSAYNRQERDASITSSALLDISQMCATISDEVHKVWSKDHHFQSDISSECGTGFFDGVLFRMLLENLLTNAFRFTPAGGSVSLRVKRNGDELLIDVADTGIGIPEIDHKKIFEAFFRSSNVDARRGLGLGLSIVREAVMSLNGSISLKSGVGDGTIFQVQLPVVTISVPEEQLP